MTHQFHFLSLFVSFCEIKHNALTRSLVHARSHFDFVGSATQDWRITQTKLSDLTLGLGISLIRTPLSRFGLGFENQRWAPIRYPLTRPPTSTSRSRSSCSASLSPNHRFLPINARNFNLSDQPIFDWLSETWKIFVEYQELENEIIHFLYKNGSIKYKKIRIKVLAIRYYWI